jgi:uncharacterized protein (DUF983 family)
MGQNLMDTRMTVALDASSFSSKEAAPRRDPWQAISKGLRGLCPACGQGKIFRSYLKVNDTCPNCGEELHHHRADDAPPYFTIFVVGHIIGTLMVLAEKIVPDAPIWAHALVWPGLTLILSLWMLPLFKGALIAYQWALRMHGFETAGHVTSPTDEATHR